MAEVISKSGRKMSPVATREVTAVKDTTPKTVALDAKKQIRRAENEEYLKDKNVKAFFAAIAKAEGLEPDDAEIEVEFEREVRCAFEHNDVYS